MIKLGEKQKLTVVKKVEFGVYLAQSAETSEDRVLLPAKQVPEGTTMCNELSKMQKDGIIEYSKNQFLLKDSLMFQ